MEWYSSVYFGGIAVLIRNAATVKLAISAARRMIVVISRKERDLALQIERAQIQEEIDSVYTHRTKGIFEDLTNVPRPSQSNVY